jgi:hypothetical protein
MAGEWLTQQEVATRLGKSLDGLRKWRAKGQGPQGWVKVNAKTIQYPRSGVMAYETALARAEEAAKAKANPVVVPPSVRDPHQLTHSPVASSAVVQDALRAAAMDAHERQAREAQAAAAAQQRDLRAIVAQLRDTVRVLLGTDLDGPVRPIAHAGEVTELECAVAGHPFVWDVRDRLLWFVSKPDDERYPVRSKADLGRAILEQQRKNDDHWPAPV